MGAMRRLALAVAVNLVLGVVAIVPIYLTWYWLSNGPFASLGWTVREPTENDGVLFWAVLAALAVAVFVAIWGLANAGLRRVVPGPASRFWPACVAATLVPFCFLLLR